MLQDGVSAVYELVFHSAVLKDLQPWAWTVIAITIAYTVWRQWCFRAHPWLYPGEVAEVPYWIPFLGHTLSLFENSATLLNQAIHHFGGLYEPFTIRVLGERLYVVTSPNDVAAVYNNKTNFSWDAYMDKLLEGFGLTELARDASWRKPQPSHSEHPRMGTVNPQYKSLVHLIEDFYKMQLLPGEHLDEMLNNVMSRLDAWLQWPSMYSPFVESFNSTSRRISTKRLCSHLVTDATTRTMFGDLIFEYEPDAIEYLRAFDDLSWAAVFNVPSIFVPKLREARGKLSAAIKKYIETPLERRTKAAWSITSVIEVGEMWELDNESRVAMLLMIWWAAHSNTINACFWMVVYAVYHPSLVDTLRKETKPAFRGPKMDVNYLANNCPLLSSTYLEVLRLVNGAMSIRRVETDTKVSGKLLKAGGLVVIPYSQLHYNPNVWGSSTHSFNPERFVQQPKLGSHSSYRPFGGGVSYCPGRHLAKAEVCGFVAAFINRFDFDVPPGPDGKAQPFPLMDTTKPATGITSCVEDMDLHIDIKPRAGVYFTEDSK